ncbi:MAG: hypothetical protein CVV44_03810 [Spirochaetae bacterium HGW-Spirochaetae-1]|jgi:phage gp46-like protein|nr:MAG: hypothetical protein CVV44_03810 [Spirochaetae bacterium HGW-Spirochaetae-1]
MTDRFDGDIKIQRIASGDNEGDYDVIFTNGQPEMTQGFDSAVLLAVFGDKNTWQNLIAKTEAEKFISDFPAVIERGVVTEKTKNDGVQALRRALQFLTDVKAAKSVTVTGQILSVYGIMWEIKIERPDGGTSRYRATYDTRNKWDAVWQSYE